MKYVSTRGGDAKKSFEDVLLAGLAEDGGLYVPEEWPRFPKGEWRALQNHSWAGVAASVMKPFVGDFLTGQELQVLVEDAQQTFSHAATTPLKQLDDTLFLLELFHGPTLAFKDVAMQILARMMDIALARRDMHITIVGATSGDTGSAAIEAFRHSRRVRIFILHPHERTSPIQRRQMTTVHAPNVHNIAIEGDFDDCQALVKQMFADSAFRARHHLAGVNSINWGRILAQVIYYATSALALGAPDRSLAYVVPTGNFGDIFAGFVAQRMGLPIDRLVIATNENDILHRALSSGRYQVAPKVVPTSSPSMDIQVSSNFERLLFEATERDASALRALMERLRQSGGFTIPEPALAWMRQLFASGRADEQQVTETIRHIHQRTGEIVDPHTAVGLSVARDHLSAAHAVVSLATAHPAKFPQAARAATGLAPTLPPHLASIMREQEHFTVLPASLEEVKGWIDARAG